jgi:hypothetical protein
VSPNARWTPSAEQWWKCDPSRSTARPAAAPAPTLTEDDDARPVAGRILGPRGDVIRVARHGEPRPPFGFGARP